MLGFNAHQKFETNELGGSASGKENACLKLDQSKLRKTVRSTKTKLALKVKRKRGLDESSVNRILKTARVAQGVKKSFDSSRCGIISSDNDSVTLPRQRGNTFRKKFESIETLRKVENDSISFHKPPNISVADSSNQKSVDNPKVINSSDTSFNFMHRADNTDDTFDRYKYK